MKKFTKRAAALALSLSMSISAGAAALAYDAADAAAKADALHTVSLFQGTDKGYELDRAPTRMEALIMLIRLTGREMEALYLGDWQSPFTDAPTWDGAAKYLGYAYEKGLTDGVSATEFDPNGTASAQMYMTFVLRALGYADGADGKVWDRWEELSKAAGVLTDGVDTKNFKRGDAAVASYAALDAKMQGGNGTLAETLLGADTFSDVALSTARVVAGEKVTASSPVMDVLGALYAGEENMPAANMYTREVTKDTLSYFFGTDALDYTEAVVSEPNMNVTPHSVGLIRLKDGADIEAAKAAILAGANPRKWICVEAENVRVENVGSLILLVMGGDEADSIAARFLALER